MRPLSWTGHKRKTSPDFGWWTIFQTLTFEQISKHWHAIEFLHFERWSIRQTLACDQTSKRWQCIQLPDSVMLICYLSIRISDFAIWSMATPVADLRCNFQTLTCDQILSRWKTIRFPNFEMFQSWRLCHVIKIRDIEMISKFRVFGRWSIFQTLTCDQISRLWPLINLLDFESWSDSETLASDPTSRLCFWSKLQTSTCDQISAIWHDINLPDSDTESNF